jgi:hypothetical protein
MLNPFSDEYIAVEIGTSLMINVKLELLEDFTVAGSVENLTISVTSLKTYFKSSVSLKEISSKITALQQPLAQAINS